MFWLRLDKKEGLNSAELEIQLTQKTFYKKRQRVNKLTITLILEEEEEEEEEILKYLKDVTSSLAWLFSKMIQNILKQCDSCDHL